MFAWMTNLNVLAAGIILAAVQFIAALPWLWAIDPKGFARASRSPAAMAYVVAGVLIAGAVVAALLSRRRAAAARAGRREGGAPGLLRHLAPASVGTPPRRARLGRVTLQPLAHVLLQPRGWQATVHAVAPLVSRAWVKSSGGATG